MAGQAQKVVPFESGKESALAEIRRQLNQGYALAAGARYAIAVGGVGDIATTLLDMAEEVLSDLEYIDRLDPKGAEGGAA